MTQYEPAGERPLRSPPPAVERPIVLPTVKPAASPWDAIDQAERELFDPSPAQSPLQGELVGGDAGSLRHDTPVAVQLCPACGGQVRFTAAQLGKPMPCGACGTLLNEAASQPIVVAPVTHVTQVVAVGPQETEVSPTVIAGCLLFLVLPAGGGVLFGQAGLIAGGLLAAAVTALFAATAANHRARERRRSRARITRRF